MADLRLNLGWCLSIDLARYLYWQPFQLSKSMSTGIQPFPGCYLPVAFVSLTPRLPGVADSPGMPHLTELSSAAPPHRGFLWMLEFQYTKAARSCHSGNQGKVIAAAPRTRWTPSWSLYLVGNSKQVRCICPASGMFATVAHVDSA